MKVLIGNDSCKLKKPPHEKDGFCCPTRTTCLACYALPSVVFRKMGSKKVAILDVRLNRCDRTRLLIMKRSKNRQKIK